MRLLMAGILLLSGLTQAAEIYRYTDEQGNTVFTDQPNPARKAQSVELSAPNQIAPPVQSLDNSVSSTQPLSTQATYQLGFVNLPEGNAFRANDGNLTLQASLAPGLLYTHQLQLLVDGQPFGSPSQSTFFHLHNLDRGAHSLILQVVQGEQVIASSPVTTIYVLRAHQ